MLAALTAGWLNSGGFTTIRLMSVEASPGAPGDGVAFGAGDGVVAGAGDGVAAGAGDGVVLGAGAVAVGSLLVAQPAIIQQSMLKVREDFASRTSRDSIERM